MPGRNLNLLSLDGGGVRGLSSLYILQRIMESVNLEDPPKPCDYFDMIGGTSTGGLIAIMLGRLQMSVDECIQAYIELSDDVFHKKRRIPANAKGDLKERYDSKTLESAVKKVIRDRNIDDNALLKDPKGTKVFVCCTSRETSATTLLRSYHSPRGANDLYKTVRIWEAARATSAASTFFDSVEIGNNGQRFLDGGTGANNPIRQLWGEAADMIEKESLAKHLSCLISIGTGQPSYTSFDDSVLGIFKTLTNIATETEDTANWFHREQSSLFDKKLCFRFNVPRGMGDIGLAETEQRATIKSMTDDHLQSQVAQTSIKSCVRALKERQSHTRTRNVLLLSQITQAEDESFHLISQDPEWQLAPTESDTHRILDRISSYQPDRMHLRFQLQKLENTTQWILKHPEFVSWLSSDQTCLWLSGIVGCGKTLVASTVIQFLLDQHAESKRCGPVVHFYFDGNQRDVLKAEDLMRSCVKQLLRHLYRPDSSLSEVIRLAVIRFFKLGAQPPTYEEIVQSLLIPLIRHFENLTVAVDGLDVCAREEYSRALETLNEIRGVSSVKILVSGRRELEIARCLPGAIHIQITSDEIGPDMALFVVDRINSRMRHKRLSDNQKMVHHMKETLIKKAMGMFLWVRLQIEMLWTTCSTDAEIRRALVNLPKDLAETYERCLQRVRVNESEYSLRVLRYVYGARSPLTILALGEALATDFETGKVSTENVPSRDTIMESGANLVILSEIDSFVLPAHHSVRQFLDSSDSEVLQQLSLPIWDDAELDLGEMSITHLWWHDHASATEKAQERPPAQAGTHDVVVPAISRMRNWIPRSKTLHLFEKVSSLQHKIGKTSLGEGTPPITITLPSRESRLITSENPFQTYAKLNWLTLTQTLTPNSAKWDCFEDLVNSPKLADASYPWCITIPRHVEGETYLRHILEWAIINHHAALLAFIRRKVRAHKNDGHSVFNTPLLGSEGLLPIHLAARVAPATIVDMLASLCDLTVPCQKTRRGVLFFATARDSPEVFDLLLRHEPMLLHLKSGIRGKGYFEDAVDTGFVTPWLIERGVALGPLPVHSTSLLFQAIKTSRNSVIDLLLRPDIFLRLRSDELGDLYQHNYDREVLSWLLQYRLAQGIQSITRHGTSLDMDIEVSNFKRTGYTILLCAPIFHALLKKDANFAIELIECGASLWKTLSLDAHKDTGEPFSIGLRPIDLALILGWQDMAAYIVKKTSNKLPDPARLTMSQTRIIVIDILRPLSRIVWMSFLVETKECKIVTVQRQYRSSCSSRSTPPTPDQERYWWAGRSTTSHGLGGTRITLSSERELQGGIKFTLMVGFCDRGASMRDTISTTARMTTIDSVTVSSQDYDLQQSLPPQLEIRGVNIMRGRIDC